MKVRTAIATRTYTLFPFTTLFRSHDEDRLDAEHHGENGHEDRNLCRFAEASQEEEVLHSSADADCDAAAEPEGGRTDEGSDDEASDRGLEALAYGCLDELHQPGDEDGRHGDLGERRHLARDRKSVVSGTSGSVRVDMGGRRTIKKK